ncbi:MAG: divergent polysaccharide deacetylase family protein, partial [Smithella sp.]
MKLLKRLLKGLLIFSIIICVAAIVYVLQWKEEPSEIKSPKKVVKKSEEHKTELPKVSKEKRQEKSSEKLPISESLPQKEKEKKEVAKAGKAPLRQRQVAIIIDDIGNDLKVVRELLEIKSDITFAVMPLCRHTRDSAEEVHKAHREVLLHLPMEPLSYPRE